MCGRNAPITEKTRMDTIATITRKVVPQRGCIVVFVRALSTVSASSAS